MLRSLLVPLDGSELAEAVLPWSLYLARERRLAVTLARVVTPAGLEGGQNGFGQSPQEVEGWENARLYLEMTRNRLADGGADVEIAVCEGEPAQTLLDLADRIDASAIAIATHGHGGALEYPMGRVAEQIVQAAMVPLLLVPVRSDAVSRAPSLRRLLVPLDGSALAERALEVATELGARGGTVQLVQVVEPDGDMLDTAEGRLPLADAEATYRARAEASAYLRGIAGTVEGDRLTVQTSVSLGEPGRQILTLAHESSADLIVMVTHGMSGTGRGWLGSVASDVVRRASAPVFLVSARSLLARVGRAYRVGDVMTRDIISVCEDEPLDTVIRRLLRRRISGAPVVGADGKLIGMITEHDLLRWQLETARARAGQSPEEPTLPELLATVRSAEVMSHLVVSVEESLPLAAAVPIFLELPYRRVPVTRHGRPVGILSRADVLKALAEQDVAGIKSMLAEAAVGV